MNASKRPFALLSKVERRRTVYQAQGGRCWYCDCMMKEVQPSPAQHVPVSWDYATWEHVSPILRNSRTHKPRPGTPAFFKSRDNLVLVCWQCNNERGTLPLTTFIAKLRENGMVFGIVSRIRRLVNDHFPTPKQASEFEWWMIQALAHPRRPADALKRLPASLESAVLPDPSQPVPLWTVHTKPPAPKRRAPPLVVRFFRTLWRCTQQLRQVLNRKEAACLKF